MAQHRTGPARQNGRHPPPAPGQLPGADGRDTTMDGGETASLDAPLDLAGGIPQSYQLPTRNDTLLPIRQLRDPPITWLLLATAWVLKSVHVPSEAQRTPTTPP